MANAEKEGMDGWSSQVRMEELLAKAATSDGRKEWYYFTGALLSRVRVDSKAVAREDPTPPSFVNVGVTNFFAFDAVMGFVSGPC